MFIKTKSAYFITLPKDEDAGLPITWINLAQIDEAYETVEGGIVLVRNENTEHYRGVQAECLRDVLSQISEGVENV